jgi:hypothetical protein
MNTATGQRIAEINVFPECSDEERARLASTLTGEGPLRRISFSGPSARMNECSGIADNTSPMHNPHLDSQS